MDGLGHVRADKTGTGGLVNAQLRGTWTAKPISEKEFVMDWKGTLGEARK